MTFNLTPRQITENLDRHIVGQTEAKRAVAIALRNRYRRSLLDEELKSAIIPKNILMIGPTGVGKTEIARRIAKLTNAPFIKVEATKFTEVGYVGRDVESIVRDLVEISRRLVKEEMMEAVSDQAEKLANEQIVKLLVPSKIKPKMPNNPFAQLFGQPEQDLQDNDNSSEEVEIKSRRRQVAQDLKDGKLEDQWVTIEVTEQTNSMFDIMPGMEQNSGMQEMLSSLMPKKTKKRKVKVKDARRLLTIEEANKIIDTEELAQEAIRRAEQSGVIFLDEIDKIASKGNQSADVSREGVQRDILPIIEGSTVTTKYGPVKTDYMLFIAAGAFHISKPSDLIPELQGRFPIRVELEKLSKEDFVRILKEPDQSLISQYKALLATENVTINFTDDAIDRIAEIAMDVNRETDNIGARRLHTILERLLEELSFEASEIGEAYIDITPAYVDQKLGGIIKNKDLSQFIL